MMLNIAILSRGTGLYSTQSLFRAARVRGNYVRVIDHKRCSIIVENDASHIIYGGEPLLGVDGVIPRIGASVTDYGAAVIKQFEMMGVYTMTRSEALVISRDKLKSLQKLASSNILVPRTFIAGSVEDVPLLIDKFGGAPVVIKLLESTHGVGVILAENKNTAVSIVEAFSRFNQPVIIQEYIEEARGADIRAFVVGKKVVAVMKRQASPGEFRSNLHRGATSSVDRLTSQETEIVLKTVKLMGLGIAGVDLLRSERGPMVMEVNASPGLEGIETTSGIDIAGEIIDYASRKIRNFKKIDKP